MFLTFYLVTVIEILPKEKKKKDEKTIILGQVTVDLLPLAEGGWYLQKNKWCDVSVH